jgi:hypothetical protein
VYHFEKLSERVAQTGFRPITLVCDLQGLGLASYYPPGLWRAQRILDVMQKGYSDGHGIPGSRIFITNAPFVFPLFWQLVRPWLRPHLQELVVVTEQGDYTALHERVKNPRMLPTSLGGERLVVAPEGPEYATLLG